MGKIIRNLFILSFLSFLVVSCVSQEALKKLNTAENKYTSAMEEYSQEKDEGKKEELRLAVEQAAKDLEQAKKEAFESRIVSGAEIGESITTGIKPVFSVLFPPAVMLLDAISRGLIGLASAYRKKES
jgi:hypothetical protein